MTEQIAILAQDDLPDIEYSRVDTEQAGYIREAMELTENQEKFEVTFLPVDTPEQRQAAAEEWAGYKQALGHIAARDRGAFAVFSSRDESPEALVKLLEDQDLRDDQKYVTSALLKVIKKNKDASTMDLLREYYHFDTWEK